MSIYKVYVRGHGGHEPQVLPPSQELPIDLVTVGQYGCTMSGRVADTIIYQRWDTGRIQQAIEQQHLIYWTHAQRDAWYDRGILQFVAPRLERHPYRTLHYNLVLQGDRDVGDCGVCYWNAAKGELTWMHELGHGEEMLLSEILELLRDALQDDDSAELYWTACMSAESWQGTRKAVSFHPNVP